MRNVCRGSCVSTGAKFPVAPVESAPMHIYGYRGERQAGGRHEGLKEVQGSQRKVKGFADSHQFHYIMPMVIFVSK